MAAPVSVAVVRNPLRPGERELYAARAGRPFIEWLQEHYPAGFGRPVVVLHNGAAVEAANLDFCPAPGDTVAILVGPGGQALAAPLIEALLVAVLSAGATLLVNAVFGKPTRPKSQDLPGPDPIYSITGAQNAARVGEPIPALYGRMITVPDYASQPYTFFSGNNQYLDQILVLGWGEFEVHDLRIGETPLSALEGDAVQFWQFGPGDHYSEMGPIATITGVMENVVTSPEVGDQELTGAASSAVGDFLEFVEVANIVGPGSITLDGTDAPDPGAYTHLQVFGSVKNNGVYDLVSVAGPTITVAAGLVDEATPHPLTFRYFTDPAALGVGPFVTSKPGLAGNRVMLDFVFPQGLYSVDETTGDLAYLTVSVLIEWQEIDDAGGALGGWSSSTATWSRNTNTPVRDTVTLDVDPGRYRVRVRRTTPAPSNAREVGALVWTGLKFRVVPTVGAVYGGVTLLVVRIRATNGIASAATSRLSADVTRRLPLLGAGPPLASTSPADAFCDIYTNATYGAGRPLAEVDTPELARLVDHWSGRAHFNGGFASRSTIWEALKLALQTAGAAPLPLGQLMSAAQDGVRALRTQLFSDANMRRGSLSIGYNFDKPGDYDGFQVEYRDPATWNAAFALWPPGALDPDQVQLFGCSDGEQAEGFARLLWNKRLLQRKTASFETELEGLIPRLGDRVAIAASLPRWAAAGIVVAVAGLTLTLDAAPDWSGSGHFVILRNEEGEPSGPLAVSPGPSPRAVVLAAAPPFAIFGTGKQEPTHYAFASATELVADFTVSNIEHRGGAVVAVDALAYNPAAFADTLPWLEEAI